MYNYTYVSNLDANTCLAKGNCSMTPDTGALREVFLNLFAYIACFILNNKCDKSAIDLIVEIIANSDIRNEFSDVQILNAIKNVYNVCETLQKDFPNFKTDIKPCIKDENQLIYSKIISKESTTIPYIRK